MARAPSNSLSGSKIPSSTWTSAEGLRNSRFAGAARSTRPRRCILEPGCWPGTKIRAWSGWKTPAAVWRNPPESAFPNSVRASPVVSSMAWPTPWAGLSSISLSVRCTRARRGCGLRRFFGPEGRSAGSYSPAGWPSTSTRAKNKSSGTLVRVWLRQSGAAPRV